MWCLGACVLQGSPKTLLIWFFLDLLWISLLWTLSGEVPSSFGVGDVNQGVTGAKHTLHAHSFWGAGCSGTPQGFFSFSICSLKTIYRFHLPAMDPAAAGSQTYLGPCIGVGCQVLGDYMASCLWFPREWLLCAPFSPKNY